jgi:hypothetical protein
MSMARYFLGILSDGDTIIAEIPCSGFTYDMQVLPALPWGSC